MCHVSQLSGWANYWLYSTGCIIFQGWKERVTYKLETGKKVFSRNGICQADAHVPWNCSHSLIANANVWAWQLSLNMKTLAFFLYNTTGGEDTTASPSAFGVLRADHALFNLWEQTAHSITLSSFFFFPFLLGKYYSCFFFAWKKHGISSLHVSDQEIKGFFPGIPELNRKRLSSLSEEKKRKA